MTDEKLSAEKICEILQQHGSKLWGNGFDFSSLAKCIIRLEKLDRELLALYNQYKEGYTPYENELVVHLVVPLLEALGWTPQRMAFEFYLNNESKKQKIKKGGKPDILLYSQNSRKPDDFIAMVEAKERGKYSDLEKAGLWPDWFNDGNQCRFSALERIIATDGKHYFVFIKKDDKWPCHQKKPCLIIEDFCSSSTKDDEHRKAVKALWKMSPDWKQ